ncbi:MAG: Enamine/imine deaminase [Candidatus Heimdallarchaeota archaeon LC_2]|nr:MAG: Enamine/imine deaminase [Candidatus Heimdallarchaeota archaeon LC_2]
MLQTVSTPHAPMPGGHFSQGKIIGNLLFTAGQIGQNINKELIQDSITEEVNQIMNNLKAVAVAAGTSLSNTVKTTIFITDIADFKEINTAYAKFFVNDPPARSTVEVSNLAIGARVEIEAIIAIPI